jgi:predicted acyltransferase
MAVPRLFLREVRRMSLPSVALSSLVAGITTTEAIDVFRDATIVAMILLNGQFSHEESYRHLAHSEWNGWTFADTIYHCFLFIVGVTLTLSTA